MGVINFSALETLLNASSKSVVVNLCNEAFIQRHLNVVSDKQCKSTATTLNVEVQAAEQLILSLRGLVKAAIFNSSTEVSQVRALFPDGFHLNLRDLLTKIIIDNLPGWQNKAASDVVSLPRLLDFDWRVDLKMSADSLSRMSVPTCILQMKIEEPAGRRDCMAGQTCVNVELPKETLDTMLDGLTKIRDQLSSVAKT